MDKDGLVKIFLYISFLSFNAFTIVILSAYSMYPLDNHLDNLVIFVLYFIHLFSISSVIYELVASHSIFGFVANISSSFQSNSEIFLNNCSKFKSHINTQLIGDIAQPNM
ncbi:MAG: hypothetical protein Q8S84_05825 [bacterium]|nr:hypothetical protein [bacterium]